MNVATAPRTDAAGLTVTPLADRTFGAVVEGVRLAAPTEAQVAAIKAAWLEHALLIFPGQTDLDDERQMAFARQFGDLVPELAAVQITNVLPDGRLREAPDDDMMKIIRGNMFWHQDNTYMPLQAKGAVFSARVVPTEKGETGFADMRAAYDALDQAMKDRIRGLEVVHSLGWSRFQADAPELSPVERENMPDTVQPLVRVHPATGRKSLYLSSHARDILGMSEAEGRALLAELTAHATQPEFVYSHHWKDGDLAMWDNRSTMHRATPFREDLYKRDMRRTTTADRVSAQAAS